VESGSAGADDGSVVGCFELGGWDVAAVAVEAVDGGMIEAQRSFRRVKGHTQMANLVTVIGHAVNPATPANYTQAVA
jgi:hypothetical protein